MDILYHRVTQMERKNSSNDENGSNGSNESANIVIYSDILYLVAIFIVVAVSPVLDHLTTTLNGLVTIRALRAQQYCLQEFYDLQDNHTSSFFMNLCANRAFAISGGTAGLILYLTIGLSMNIQMTIRNTADLENQMTSVERILEYSELESEESPKEADSRLNVSPDWPLEGSIHFQD
ncbi:unnamed protein product, partial [Oppiella nova]